MKRQKTVTISPDISATSAEACRLRCDCGWEEKAFLRDAERVASTHIRVKHTTGHIAIST